MVSTSTPTFLHEIPETSGVDDFIWACQINVDSEDATQKVEWMPYPDPTSSVIENAYQRGDEQAIIDEDCCIDLKQLTEVHTDHSDKQRRIRRERRYSPSLSSGTEAEQGAARSKRLSFPLSSVTRCSTSEDTNYHGSSFIIDWLLKFTKGELNVTFDSIFPVLVQGLQYEGRSVPAEQIDDIVNELYEVKEKNHGKKEEKKIQELQICCTKLYTKECYIFRVVNTTLRDNDRSKLDSLGPYIYLVYDYIGCGRHTNNLSIYQRFRQSLRLTKPHPMIVYRGDRISLEILEKYRQASGDKTKYFKWLPFVSTSLKRTIAEKFARNVLYIIELQRDSTYDLFTNLIQITEFQEEEEILLQPGVRFLVNKVESDNLTGLSIVYMKIVSSYVSNLR